MILKGATFWTDILCKRMTDKEVKILTILAQNEAILLKDVVKLGDGLNKKEINTILYDCQKRKLTEQLCPAPPKWAITEDGRTWLNDLSGMGPVRGSVSRREGSEDTARNPIPESTVPVANVRARHGSGDSSKALLTTEARKRHGSGASSGRSTPMDSRQRHGSGHSSSVADEVDDSFDLGAVGGTKSPLSQGDMSEKIILALSNAKCRTSVEIARMLDVSKREVNSTIYQMQRLNLVESSGNESSGNQNRPLWNLSERGRSQSQMNSENADRSGEGAMVRSPSETGIKLKDFENLEILGKGAFGTVFKGKHKIDEKFYAIKEVHIRPKYYEDTKKEVKVLADLQHRNVVRYHTCWMDDVNDSQAPRSTSSYDSESDSDGIAFEASDNTSRPSPKKSGVPVQVASQSKSRSSRSASSSVTSISAPGISAPAIPRTLYIKMELCEQGTLLDVIKKDLHKDQKRAWAILKDITDGLDYVHKKNVIHRDIKAENIFMTIDGHAKIGDFGLSAQIITPTPGEVHEEANLSSHVGTPTYQAPEMESKNYNSKVDMYSLGLTFFEMLYRHLEPGMERAIIFKDLKQQVPQFPKDFNLGNNEKAIGILRKLLEHNPTERFSAQQVLGSPQMMIMTADLTVTRSCPVSPAAGVQKTLSL